MSSITHLLFVVGRYCKQIWFQQQSGTSDWYGSDYWGRWNLQCFSSRQSALCLRGTSYGNIPKWASDWDWHLFFFIPFYSPLKESAFMSSRRDYDAFETERFNQWEQRQYLGHNRAYLTVFFSFVLMRLHFASFQVHLSHSVPVGFVKSGCKNTCVTYANPICTGIMAGIILHVIILHVRQPQSCKTFCFPAAKFTFLCVWFNFARQTVPLSLSRI